MIRVEKCIREEENSFVFYVANWERNLIRGVSVAETINTRETITSVEFQKQKAKELKESGVKNECMDNSLEKRQRTLIKKKRGNCYQKMI